VRNREFKLQGLYKPGQDFEYVKYKLSQELDVLPENIVPNINYY